MTRFLITALLASTILTSCTLEPLYNRPAAPVSPSWPQGAAYKDQASAPAGEMNAASIAWKDFFLSPKLQQIIQTALDNNRDYQVAALNVEAARQLYRVQRSALVPTIDVVGSGSRQNIPDNAGGLLGSGIQSQYTANIGTTAFELDLFGRVRSLNKQALEEYFATAEAKNATRIALIAETANAYLVLLADQKLLKLTEDTLAAQQKSYDLVKRIFDAGVGNKLEVSQAAQTVETARANLSVYQRLVAQDKNALVLLMGVPAESEAFEGETLDNILVLKDLPAGIPSEVLLDRPDVRAAEHSLKAANANIGAARAAFLPQISLTASTGFASDSLSNLFSSGSGGAWSFVPQITAPIFTGGRNLANLGVSKATRQIRVAEYEKSIQIAFREVADELAARGTFTDQLKAQQSLAAAAQEAYNLSDARYKQGIENYLNVLDAQRSLYVAQQNQIIVEQQRLSNLVTLYKVLGGGQI